MQSENATEDVLSTENYLVRANHGQRALNYIIDFISFCILMSIIAVFGSFAYPDLLQGINPEQPVPFTFQVVVLLIYATYMSAIEAIFKGKTLGKVLTGTRAVFTDGARIDTRAAFNRGFSRAVPFCWISALGNPCNPWQDKWTDTMVIDEKKSILNRSSDILQ